MNVIQLEDNVSFETYQKILSFLDDLGVKVKNKPTKLEHGLTEEDFKRIEISHQQAENGEMLSSEEVHQQMWAKYGN